MVPLRDVGHKALRLISWKSGLADTVCFEETLALPEPLGDDEVQVEIKAFGLNKKVCGISSASEKLTTYHL